MFCFLKWTSLHIWWRLHDLCVSWSCFETVHCGNKAWYSWKQSTSLGANYDPSVSPASWTGFRLDLHEKWVSGELEPWAIAVCQQLHKTAFSFSRSDTRPDHSHYSETTGKIPLKSTAWEKWPAGWTRSHMHWLQIHKTFEWNQSNVTNNVHSAT